VRAVLRWQLSRLAPAAASKQHGAETPHREYMIPLIRDLDLKEPERSRGPRVHCNSTMLHRTPARERDKKERQLSCDFNKNNRLEPCYAGVFPGDRCKQWVLKGRYVPCYEFTQCFPAPYAEGSTSAVAQRRCCCSMWPTLLRQRATASILSYHHMIPIILYYSASILTTIPGGRYSTVYDIIPSSLDT
jgi:hypothetical protein